MGVTFKDTHWKMNAVLTLECNLSQNKFVTFMLHIMANLDKLHDLQPVSMLKMCSDDVLIKCKSFLIGKCRTRM